ncbi:hypothetical protein SGHV014 [Glossina pallidipes salivary gland hypertrophy virus]|uniref:Uncharacterized protein n=1 Tax=Glossina hytrovirus (isolate Glossina pallidipes/Ethiopia/Seibersdorf/-) TaxID=379529 RepID=B0YLG8_GHVS|nr:hypothetical protein SGHV014 [Glossina pallidipes salivary gland hypertrophy virus]ABQ08787.1 hypothetical protein SGHV014 [Glossina pallidipes salivary gland hypertrophy virus]
MGNGRGPQLSLLHIGYLFRTSYLISLLSYLSYLISLILSYLKTRLNYHGPGNFFYKCR